jgi:hypothetical protein
MTKIAIVPNAAGTGTFTIEAPNSNSNRTLVLPDAAGSVVVNEGSGAFKIDSAGNVGIGTTAPAQALEVSGVDARIRNTATNFTISNLNSLIEFNGSDGRAGFVGPLSGDMTFRTDTAKAIVFQTNGASERARIDSSGNFLVGTTTASVTGAGLWLYNDGGSYGRINFGSGITGSSFPAVFYNNVGSAVGSISYTTTTTTFGTSSDYRLKEDVQPMVGSVDRLMALKPVNFAWKVDGSRVDGFLAHEAQEVVPECVTGEKDEVDDEGNPVYQGIDQSKIVPLLVAALQEALAEIATLKADVAELRELGA